MPYPKDIRIHDLMVNIPTDEHNAAQYAAFKPLQRDAESLGKFTMPAQYMLKNVPTLGSDTSTYVDAIIAEMDRFNVETALIRLSMGSAILKRPSGISAGFRSRRRSIRTRA